MSESPPTLPPPAPVEKSAIAGKWMLWIVAAAVLPGLAFASAENRGGAAVLGQLLLYGGLIGQFVMSIILGIALSKRLGKGAGMAVLLVIVLLIASVVVGCCSAAAGCAVAGTGLDFK